VLGRLVKVLQVLAPHWFTQKIFRQRFESAVEHQARKIAAMIFEVLDLLARFGSIYVLVVDLDGTLARHDIAEKTADVAAYPGGFLGDDKVAEYGVATLLEELYIAGGGLDFRGGAHGHMLVHRDLSRNPRSAGIGASWHERVVV
jgi:hypothetical protein